MSQFSIPWTESFPPRLSPSTCSRKHHSHARQKPHPMHLLVLKRTCVPSILQRPDWMAGSPSHTRLLPHPLQAHWQARTSLLRPPDTPEPTPQRPQTSPPSPTSQRPRTQPPLAHSSQTLAFLELPHRSPPPQAPSRLHAPAGPGPGPFPLPRSVPRPPAPTTPLRSRAPGSRGAGGPGNAQPASGRRAPGRRVAPGE